MGWTENKLKALLRQGKIRGYRILGKKKKPVPGARKGKGDAEKAKIAWSIYLWCKEQAVQMETEYRFDEEREWRFDWAIRAFKIAIEYEGLFSEKSGHTTVTGYTGDTEKYNAAAAAGWTVIRFTALTVGNVTQSLDACISRR